MSMTTVNAKTYVARILGGAASQAVLDMAGEAILRAYSDWQSAKFWTFLLKDTSNSTLVTGCTATASSATVNAPTTGAFDFVNVGQTVTISSGTATLAAGTTVSSFTRNTDGTIASITLSNSFGGTTNTNATLTFSADIPLTAGTNEYNVPTDFNGSYAARLIDSTGPKDWLKFIEQRHWDKVTTDQTLQGVPEAYTTYNPYSEQTQNYGTTRLRVFKTPDASTYVIRLRYFRSFVTTGTYIDVPDQYLYKFLDYASSLLLERKRAADNPDGYVKSTADSFEQAQQNDEQPNDDDDGDVRLKSPYEQGDVRPIVGNGAFDPFPF